MVSLRPAMLPAGARSMPSSRKCVAKGAKRSAANSKFSSMKAQPQPEERFFFILTGSAGMGCSARRCNCIGRVSGSILRVF